MNSCRVCGAREPGKGPRGLAAEVPPLPFATSSVLPSVETRTEVGNQPTGINPSEIAWPGFETSKAAMLLLFALATNKSAPSGESATLLGIEPGGELGNNEALSCSVARPVAVSSTLTLLRFDSATKSRPSFP